MRVVKAHEGFGYDHTKAGVFSFVTVDKEILKQVTTREDLCLKVFFNPQEHIEGINQFNLVWGREIPILTYHGLVYEYSSLADSMFAQNIASCFNLAPHIYEFLWFEYGGKYYPALLQDCVLGDTSNGWHNLKEFGLVVEMSRVFGITFKQLDFNAKNFIHGKMVDWQNVTIDYAKAREVINKIFDKHCVWSGVTYQPDFTARDRLTLRPDAEVRANEVINRLIAVIPYLPKQVTIWDIGCSGGYMLKRLVQFFEGSVNRAVGVDKPDVIYGTKLQSVLDNYNSCEWVGRDLIRDKKLRDLPKPDVIVFASVQRYFGLPSYLKRARVLIYEHNGDESYESVLAKLQSEYGYNAMIDVGAFNPRDNRRVCILYKKS